MSKRTQKSDRAVPSASGPAHRYPMLFALLFATLLTLSSGCTSSRLMQSKGFAWLGDKEDGLNLQSESFPPPSAVEVPLSVSKQRAINSGQALPGLVAGSPSSVPTGMNRSVAPPNAPGAPGAPHPSLQNQLVQNGLYGNGQIDHTATPAPNDQVIMLPPPTAPVQPGHAVPPPTAIVQPIPTSPPAYLQSTPAPLREQPITNQPLNSSGGNSAFPGMQASANEPIAPSPPAPRTLEHVTPIPLPATPPMTAYVSPHANGGTYYQQQATQPRPWRPGSTSDFDQDRWVAENANDLKTL